MSELARIEAGGGGDRWVIRLIGEVDISNAGDVGRAIEAAVPNDALDVAIDLSATRYLDSAGLSLLVRLSQRLEARRQRLRLVIPMDSPVRAVVELTGLPKVLGVEPAPDARTS